MSYIYDFAIYMRFCRGLRVGELLATVNDILSVNRLIYKHVFNPNHKTTIYTVLITMVLFPNIFYFLISILSVFVT